MSTKRIAILSKSTELHATRRLCEVAVSAGHSVDFLPTLQCSIVSGSGRAELRVSGESVIRPDVVIGRVGTFMTPLGLAVLRAFERMGVPCLNSSASIELSRDKQRSLERLTEMGVAIPATVYVKDLDQAESAVLAVGGPPAVIKPIGGTQGQGVILADSMPAAVSVVEALLYLNRDVLVQRFVAEANGEDRRLFVVAGEVVAAVERRAADGDFRANHHRGATMTAWTPDEATAEIAVRCAQAFGLQVAGVDLLVAKEGPVVLELNGAPGLEGIERATGRDVAAAIVTAAVAASDR